MRFYLPRRHRSRLLFPSGLLALAGLLWLGSVAIRSWQEKLTQRSVIEVGFPPKPDSDTIYHTSYYHEPQTIPFLYSQLFTLYNWQEIEFNGNSTHDSVSTLLVSQIVQALRADTIPNCGIRVCFGPQAKYRTFVHLLNLMLLNSQKKHLFDLYHGNPTLYVLVDDYTPLGNHTPQIVKQSEYQQFCGTSTAMSLYGLQPKTVYQSVAYITRFNNWLAALWNPKLKDTTWYTSAVGTGTEYDITIQLEKQYWPDDFQELISSLKQPEWRLQFLLILCMVAISWWKLKRQLKYR